MATAAELAGRFGLRRQGHEWRGRCPCCGKPSLALEDRGGRTLWRCFYGCAQPDLTRALFGDAVAPVAPAARAEDGDRRAAALAMWERGMPLAPGNPAQNYLTERGVPPPAGAPLRYLPDAKHPSGQRLGCMLALVTDAGGRPVALHRTFLAPGGAGKAKVDPVRMTLGQVRGGAVRLHPAGARLVVGEGIETTLSAGRLLQLPAWAAVSAGNMGDALILPPEVQEVVLAVDNDPPGRDAARRAAARWKREGREVQLAMPDTPGTDFNDLLRERLARGG